MSVGCRAEETAIDGLVGLGGGSSMDTAKGCNFVLTNGGRMQDYWGVGKATRPMLPLIAIPTTAGTGSECQSFALIADVATHQKMACGDPKAAARVALLDPALTLSQPPRGAACTGLDALSHALETAVSKKRNALSLAYSREALRLCLTALPLVLQKSGDLEARAGMLLGAALGGLAIENSMLGAAHAAANPLTAHFHLVHGQAVGLMLPSVIRFNAARSKKPPASTTSWAETKAAGLAAKVEWLLNLAGMPRSLAECSVATSSIPMLAAEAPNSGPMQASIHDPSGRRNLPNCSRRRSEPRGIGALLRRLLRDPQFVVARHHAVGARTAQGVIQEVKLVMVERDHVLVRRDGDVGLPSVRDHQATGFIG